MKAKKKLKKNNQISPTKASILLTLKKETLAALTVNAKKHNISRNHLINNILTGFVLQEFINTKEIK